jgi:hypothetical protein
VANEVAGHSDCFAIFACELRVFGLCQFAVFERGVEIAHREIALCDCKVDVCHADVSALYFVQGNHIVIYSFLILFHLIRFVSNFCKTLAFMFRGQTVFI